MNTNNSVIGVGVRRLVQALWVVSVALLGVALFLLLLFGPLYFLAWGLVTFIGCDPGLAILLAMAVGVPWGILMPYLFA